MSNNAVIYCRISTKKQEVNWSSLVDQEKICRNFCATKEIKVEKVFQETCTWKTSNRIILQDAIEYAIGNWIRYFIVADIDRLTREWYAVYTKIKKSLSEHWIQLLDTKNIVSEDKQVYQNDKVDMAKYSWNHYNPWINNEVAMSTAAESEWKKILQRTIPREIALEQSWCHVRASNFWFMNKKISLDIGRATIQIPHPIESSFVIELFEKIANWAYTNQEIVDALNSKWAKKRRKNQPFDIKYMQELVKNPIYAWVIYSKWTWYQAIKASYEWLVSVELWNQANKWKRSILISKDWWIKLILNSKEWISDQTYKRKRSNYNSIFQYAKVLKCPHCWWVLTWNTSTSWNWTKHNYYQCTWKGWIKHKTYTLKRDLVNNEIEEILKSVSINNEIIDLFKEITVKVYHEREQELTFERENIKRRIQLLNKDYTSTNEFIDNVLKYPDLLERQYRKMKNLEEGISGLKESLLNLNDKIDLESFLEHSEKFITQLWKLALQKEKPDTIKLIFDTLFWERIVFEEINYHTSSNPIFFSAQSQQKNSSNEEFSEKLNGRPTRNRT